MTPTDESGTTRYRAALSWSVLMVGGQQGLTALVSFALAAILGPSSFGTVAMAAVYILFMQMLLQQAIPAIIQRKDLETEHLDSAFWLVMAATVVITGFSIALSGPWAALNRTPDLQPIIVALSLLVPLQGLVVVQEAVLRRSMDFRSLAVRSLAAAALGGVVGITMALRGAGTWALVGQQLGTGIVGAIVLWHVSPWRPRLRFSWAHARDLVGFSVGSSLASLATFVNARSDVLLIGLFFGAFAVGLYRLASRFTEIFVDFLSRSIQQVAFPELSRLQTDTAAFARRMRDIMAQSSLLTFPALGVLAGCAVPLLRLFGPEWAGASDALQILCLVAAVRALTLIGAAGIQAIGRPHVFATLSWLAAALSAGSLVAAGLALRDAAVADQVLGMAASRAVVYLGVIGPIEVVVIHRCCAVTPRSLLGAVRDPGLIGVAAALAGTLWTLTGTDGSWSPLVALAATGAVTGSVAIGLLAVVNRSVLVSAGRTARRLLVPRAWAPGAYKPRHIQTSVVSQMLTADGSGLDEYEPRHVTTPPVRQSGEFAAVPKRTIVARHPPPRRRTRIPRSNLTMDIGGRMGGRPHGDQNGSRRTDVSHGASSVDLWASLGVIGRRWKVTVPLVLLTLVASLMLGARVSPDYEASSTILLIGPAGPNSAAGAPSTATPSQPPASDPAAESADQTTTTQPATTVAPPVTEPDTNPLLSLNQSLITTARATLEAMNDDSVRGRLAADDLSTEYEVTVAQRDPIMQIVARAPGPRQALETVGALQGIVLEDLNARQDQAGAPANTRIQVQTLSTTSQPKAINESQLRAQLVVVALGLVLTVVVAFGLEALEQHRVRMAALKQRARDSRTMDEGPPSHQEPDGEDERRTRVASSSNGGSGRVGAYSNYGSPGRTARRGSSLEVPSGVDPQTPAPRPD